MSRKIGLINIMAVSIMILGGATSVSSLFFSIDDKPKEIPLSEAIAMSQNHKIVKIVVERETLIITDTRGSEFRTSKEANTRIYDIRGFNFDGVVVEVKAAAGPNIGVLLINFLPLLIWCGFLLLVLGGLLFFLFRVAERYKRQ